MIASPLFKGNLYLMTICFLCTREENIVAKNVTFWEWQKLSIKNLESISKITPDIAIKDISAHNNLDYHIWCIFKHFLCQVFRIPIKSATNIYLIGLKSDSFILLHSKHHKYTFSEMYDLVYISMRQYFVFCRTSEFISSHQNNIWIMHFI